MRTPSKYNCQFHLAAERSAWHWECAGFGIPGATLARSLTRLLALVGVRGRAVLTSDDRVRRGPSPGCLAGVRAAFCPDGRGQTDFGGVVRAKAFALTAPGQPVFGDLRRCNGVQWKRGPVERFTGWRWNGAEWNRLELAKSGPSPADVSLKAAFGDSSAVQGSRGRSVAFSPIIEMAAAVCAAAVADERGAEKSAAGEFRESGFGQGIVKGNDRIQLRGQRLQ